MTSALVDTEAAKALNAAAAEQRLDVVGGKVRRTSSRFCFGVEHGDYNGTEQFGVGTDRFIWLAWKPNRTNRVRLASANFPEDGLVEFACGQVPEPGSPEVKDTWARFPCGADHVLNRKGYPLRAGFDAVVYGNIPGGGMSRSASLSINLVLTMLEVNGIREDDGMKIVDLAQAVENDYIGSPCGKLDQVMIYFAREGQGTHYHPGDRSVTYVPLGADAPDFRIVGLDTGTVRPGLEKSTYRIRRAECDELAGLAAGEFGISCLADVRDAARLEKIIARFGTTHPGHCDRLTYIFHAQQRFGRMLEAWKAGDIETVGALFRADGRGLRDQYRISGPELETMCDIARTVPGVYGERMLGGGDKGASGALVAAGAVNRLKAAVGAAYPLSHPEYADRYSVHVCKTVDGVSMCPGL
jgi:galactokinase